MFQDMSVRENVFNDLKKRYEEINRFRTDDITQHLTNVDIEKIDRPGSYFVKILEVFLCDNLEISPFERFIIDITDNRKKFKEENKTLFQTLIGKVSYSLYDGCIGKDIGEAYKCVTWS